MTNVNVGGIITAAHYNTLQARINRFFGDDYTGSSVGGDTEANYRFGWGNSEAIAVGVGDIINASEWNDLIYRTEIGIIQTGMGSAIGYTINAGDIIDASHHNDIDDQSTIVSANKNVIAASQISTYNQTSVIRSTNWSTRLVYEGTLIFASYDKARYFFNSGGDFRFIVAMAGGSGSIYTDWASLCSNMGTVIFGLDDVAQSGSGATIASSSGFYDIGTSYPGTPYLKQPGTGLYATNELELYAKISADGTVVTFKVQLNNDAYGDAYDIVTGTTTLTPSYRKADDQTVDGVSFSITAPSYTTTNNFNTADDS